MLARQLQSTERKVHHSSHMLSLYGKMLSGEDSGSQGSNVPQILSAADMAAQTDGQTDG